MENASQALIIAARVILAAMILAVLVYFFRVLRIFPTSDDEAKKIEQARIFNLEYEVYDKKLMYGVDLISCLNKAKSNNEKYIEGKFLSGARYGTAEEFYIQIEFHLKKQLYESIEVSYVAKTQEGVSTALIKERAYTNGSGPTVIRRDGGYIEVFDQINAAGVLTQKGVFKLPSSTYRANIQRSLVTDLKTKPEIETKISAGTYKLMESNNTIPVVFTKDGEGKGIVNETINDLLSTSDEIRQQVRNTDKATNVGESGVDGNDKWSSAEWKTALYDLKTRKFRCTEVHYSDITSRIDKIVFVEIEI